MVDMKCTVGIEKSNNQKDLGFKFLFGAGACLGCIRCEVAVSSCLLGLSRLSCAKFAGFAMFGYLDVWMFVLMFLFGMSKAAVVDASGTQLPRQRPALGPNRESTT